MSWVTGTLLFAVFRKGDIMSKQRFLVFLVLLVLAIVWLPVSALANDLVELTFLSWTGFYGVGAADEAVVARFNELHSDIHVSFQSPAGSQELLEKVILMVSGGAPPDLAQLRFSGAPLYEEIAIDISPYVERDGFELSQFKQPMLDLVTRASGIYGLPVDWGSMLLYYNRSRFDGVGLLPPEYGWTTADFRSAAQKLTADTNGDGETDLYGANIWRGHVYLWGQLFGGKFVEDGELAVGKPEFIQALEWLQQLFVSDKVVGGNGPQGTAAMWADWDAFISQYTTSELHRSLDWGTSYFPRGGNAPTLTYSQGHALSIIRGSKHPDEAWEFLKFYCSPEAEQIRARFGMGLIRLGEMARTWVISTPVPPDYDREELFRPVLEPPEIRTVPWQVKGLSNVLSDLVDLLQNDILTGAKAPHTAVEAALPALQRHIQ